MGRVLVLGGGGRLARAFGAACGEALLIARAELDLTRPETIGPALDAARPSIVLNTAAMADVDRCEAEPDLAFAVNADGPERLARECAARGLPLIHISTDYVFASDDGPAFTEADTPNATGVYGRSKALGETAVLEAGGAACVARVAWLFGHDQDFLRTLLRRAAVGAPLQVFDQTGSPTPLGPLVERIERLAALMVARRPVPPILHLCGDPPATRVEWLRAALATWIQASGRSQPEILTAPATAPRPRFSALDASLSQSLFGEPLDWRPHAEQVGLEIAISSHRLS